MFANGAVTAAVSYAFASLGDSEGAARSSVTGGEPGRIAAEDAEALHRQVLEVLSTIGIDTSGIQLAPGYGLRDRRGNHRTVSTYEEFIKLSRRRGWTVVGGYHTTVREPGPWYTLGLGGRTQSIITIYYNAYSTPIYSVPLTNRVWNVTLEAGFQSGLFVVGHEIGHRRDHHSEPAANEVGRDIYRQVCSGDPRC